MPKENRRVALTRLLLKEGLLRLLMQKDISAVTVTELCAESGINRATFYKHYTLPQEILSEIQSDIILDLSRTAADFGDGADIPDDITDPTERYLLAICTYFHDNADLMRVLIRSGGDADIACSVGDIALKFRELGILSARFGDLDDDGRRLVAAFLGSGGYYLLRLWLIEEVPKTPREIAALIMSIIGGGN